MRFSSADLMAIDWTIFYFGLTTSLLNIASAKRRASVPPPSKRNTFSRSFDKSLRPRDVLLAPRTKVIFWTGAPKVLTARHSRRPCQLKPSVCVIATVKKVNF